MNRNRLVVLGAIAVVAVLALVAILSSGGDDDDTATAGLEQYREVTITGEALPQLADPDADPAVGRAMPELRGRSFAGTDVVVVRDGRPKVLIFLAHWCPHCQKEVRDIGPWLRKGGAGDDVDVLAVSTSASSARPNWPPSAWLERERWPVATFADDEDSSAALAYGLSSFPYFVFVDAGGDVVRRETGELPVDTIERWIGEISR